MCHLSSTFKKSLYPLIGNINSDCTGMIKNLAFCLGNIDKWAHVGHWCQLKLKCPYLTRFCPHPLTPSPKWGEGEQEAPAPLSPLWERGWGGGRESYPLPVKVFTLS